MNIALILASILCLVIGLAIGYFVKNSQVQKENAVSLKEHESEWSEIFDGIHNVIDAVAFQDGHIDYNELTDFFTINKQLANKYGMQCWTNAESFDRDMPIKFFPIKFEKMIPKNSLIYAPHGMEFYLAYKTPFRPRSFYCLRQKGPRTAWPMLNLICSNQLR